MKALLLEQSDKEILNSIKQDTSNIVNKLTDTKRYGFRINKSESDCAARVEYIYDAVGMIPAHMNYESGVFDYGSWGNVWFIKDNYACMVKSNGSEDYKLNPNDYSQKLDGGASDYNNVAYDGNAMAAIPLCWVKRYEEGNYEYVIFCQTQYDNSYKAYAHTKADGTISNIIYHATFKGSSIDGKLRSLANQPPECNTNAETELSLAKANGDVWSIRSWSVQNLIADLCTLISKTEQSQTAFGQGQTTGYVDNPDTNWGKHITGSLYNKGQFWGTNDMTHQVKVFHIEDFWGNRWDRLQGLIQQFGVCKVKMTPEGTGYNWTGEGYQALPAAPLEEGWQKDTYMSELGRIPITAQGSDNTYVSDYFWVNKTWGETLVALSGGYCIDGSGCGSRNLSLYDSGSGAVWYFGASLQLI